MVAVTSGGSSGGRRLSPVPVGSPFVETVATGVPSPEALGHSRRVLLPAVGAEDASEGLGNPPRGYGRRALWGGGASRRRENVRGRKSDLAMSE